MSLPLPMLQQYRLRTQFKQGAWGPTLLERADHQLKHKPSSQTLVNYIDIRHAIRGFHAESIEEILAIAQTLQGRLSSAASSRVAALCLEYNVPLPSRLSTLHLDKRLARYPSLLAGAVQSKMSAYPERLPSYLKVISSKATGLRDRTYSLTDKLSALPDIRTIAVVGNAPTECGKSQRQQIDSADIIFRFNNALTGDGYREAYGTRTDFWVVSPSYKIQTGSLKAKNIVVSGVSPFDKPSQYWQTLADIAGVEYYLFPRSVWYELVARLQAPPSAGLLCLATLLQWRAADMTVKTYGINQAQVTAQNHYGDSVKRSKRHNWAKESALVRQLLAAHSHNADYAANEKSSESRARLGL